MEPTQRLHDLSQSVWLDNITRDLLSGGKLKRYMHELSVTGLTSNPTILWEAGRHLFADDGNGESMLNQFLAQGAIWGIAILSINGGWDLARCSPNG